MQQPLTMRERTGHHRAWSVGVAATGYLVLTSLLLLTTVARNGGRFVFPFDDPYIHAAMARNLVDHGVWGVTPLHYASASSAPAWTLLLAAAQWVHLNTITAAWVLNAVFGVAVVALAVLATDLEDLRGPGAVIGGLAILVVGLVPVTVMGMEPVMFAAAILAVVVLAERCAAARTRGPWAWIALGAASLTMGGTRFESMFVAAGVVAGLLAWGLSDGFRWQFVDRRRQLSAAALVAIGTALPILVAGLLNRAHGEYFLPNSVEAKTKLRSGLLQSVFSVDGFNAILNRATGDPLLVAAAATGAAGLVVGLRRRDVLTTAASAALVASWVGMALFGDTSLARYVFFIYVLAVVIGIRLVQLVAIDRRRLAAWAAAGGMLALVIPGIKLDLWVPRASHEIYRQQYQMARFLHDHYDHAGVALNDIGAVSYMHHGDLLDLLGLGSFDVLERIKAKTLTADAIDQLAAKHHVEVAVLYREWFASLPASWHPVERWCFSNPFTWSVGGPCVTWLGIGPSNTAGLKRKLALFDKTLPAGIRVEPLSP